MPAPASCCAVAGLPGLLHAHAWALPCARVVWNSNRPLPRPQVYTVAGGKNIPAWLSDKKKKALKKDEDYRRRVDLIQDFEFPAACQRIKVTPDGQYIFASGYHPPQVRPGCRCRLLSPNAGCAALPCSHGAARLLGDMLWSRVVLLGSCSHACCQRCCCHGRRCDCC